MERETILILDFGSQYTQLIARRLREMQVYSEILPPGTRADSLAGRRPRGIVLSGGPDSVHQRGAPRCDPRLFHLGVPVVGICYGMQLMSHVLGGEVKRSGHREYGQAVFSPKPGGTLFRGLPPRSRVWMSHGDDVRRAPPGFRVVGATETNAIAAVEDRARRLYGMLFHPEVVHSEEGTQGPRQLPRRLRVPPRLERALVRRGGDRPGAGAGGAGGPRHLRALRGRRLRGGGDDRAPGDREPPHLRVRGQRPAAQGGGDPGPAPLQGKAPPEGGLRGRLPALPEEAGARRPSPSASGRSSAASSSRSSGPPCARRGRPTSSRRGRSTRT